MGIVEFKKMNIFQVDTKDTIETNWDYEVKFTTDDTEAVLKWICENFKEHFVLTEHAWRIIGGGFATQKDNNESLDIRDDNLFGTEYYQINCAASDFMRLKLTWQ